MRGRLGQHQCGQVKGHGWWVGEDVCRSESPGEDVGDRIVKDVGGRLCE